MNTYFHVLKKSVNFSRMSFASAFGHFPKWFHFLGQSTFSPSATQITTLSAKNLSKYIPTGVLLILAISAAILLCKYATSFGEYTLLSSFSKIANIQLAVLLTFDLLTVFIVAGQAIFQPSHYSNLYAQIIVIEQLSSKKFTLDLNGLRRVLIRRMGIICGAFSLPYIAISFTKQITHDNLMIMACDCTLATLSLITYFHALFYIQLLNHMLKSFVKYVEFRATTFPTMNITTINCRESKVTLIKLELYYFKLMHFNLCEYAQTINQIFGWILFIYLLDHSLYTVYIFFQTCIIFFNPTNFIEIFRKPIKENL